MPSISRRFSDSAWDFAWMPIEDRKVKTFVGFMSAWRQNNAIKIKSHKSNKCNLYPGCPPILQTRSKVHWIPCMSTCLRLFGKHIVQKWLCLSPLIQHLLDRPWEHDLRRSFISWEHGIARPQIDVLDLKWHWHVVPLVLCSAREPGKDWSMWLSFHMGARVG